LLFFKNKNFPELIEKLGEADLGNIASTSLYDFIQRQRSDHTYLPSLSALIYYYLGITELIASYENKIKAAIEAASRSKNVDENTFFASFAKQDNPILKALFLLHPACQGILNNNVLFNLGNLLSRIGDALIASISSKSLEETPLTQETLILFGDSHFDEIHEKDTGILQAILKLMSHKRPRARLLENLCDINKALAIYRMAGLFYLKASRTYSYAFQYKKFLFVLKDYLLGVGAEKLLEGLAAPQDTPENVLQLIRENCEGVAVKVFNANTWLSDVSNRPQILKYREVLRAEQPHFDRAETRKIYLSLSTSGDIRETIVLVEEIMLKTATLLNIPQRPEDIEKLKTHLTPYDLVTNRFARTHELRYNSEVNFYKLKRKQWDIVLKSSMLSDMQMLGILDNQDIKERILTAIINHDKTKPFSLPAINFPDQSNHQAFKVASIEAEIKERLRHDKTPLQEAFPELSGWDPEQWQDLNQEWVKQLICDSIFSLFEVIRTLNLYGTNYISNYSFLANVHFKLANWCQIALNFDLIMAQMNKAQAEAKTTPLCDHLEAPLNEDATPAQEGERSAHLRDLLKATLNEEDIHYLEPNYHNELAIQHYYSAIQTHNGGKAFKKFNQAMSFLEDDFNDNLTLFSAACERFRINTGLVDGKIHALKQKVRFSSIYDYGNYVEGWSFRDPAGEGAGGLD
jgi:hypothetical protein